MINGYSDILKSLHTRYFLSFDKHSSVTSSYWQRIGQQNVRWTGSEIELEGFGFGDFKLANRLSSLRFLPQGMLARGLLRRYQVDSTLKTQGRSISKKSGRLFDFDAVRQVLTMDHILRKIKTFKSDRDTDGLFTCIIGDGYGFMTSLLNRVFPKSPTVSVNLGRTLLFDVYYSQKILPQTQAVLLETNSDPILSTIPKGLIFIEAENYHLLEKLPIALFINMASMQEMSPFVTQKYFDLMRSSKAKEKYFYCCNREEKTLPDGEIVRFEQYPWKSTDTVLTDELCPWNQQYPASFPPFWRPFDGPIRHRLVRFN